ncbi:MAG: oligoendopeptidase F [Eubacteriales bacterium]|nr:oligoendopeptidase F [Eubacteriales bacterium]
MNASAAVPGKSGRDLPARDQLDPKYKWKLEDIFPGLSMWEQSFDKVKTMLPEISALKGTLSQGSDSLLKCLRLSDKILSEFDKVFVYARMKRDEDNGNSSSQGIAARAASLAADVGAAVSFIVPELLSISEADLHACLDKEKALEIYRQFIGENLRQKEHILSAREEELLAMASDMSQAPKDIFTMLNNADIKFPLVKDENGDDIELTKGRYTTFMESKSRQVRSDAFHALYGTYGKLMNTITASFSGSVRKDIFFMKARKYSSCIEKSLDSDNIKTDVYDNLVDAVNEGLPLLQRYLEIRKKALKLDSLHMYDLYVSIVDQPQRKIAYEEALATVKEGLAALGPGYSRDLAEGLGSGWIDVYENSGKTSGAYSWGAYKTHPYVLLNYQGNINDIFTIAHEMGHALHTYYTNKTQPYINSEYRIFVAEVASTVNEILLMRHMLGKTKDRAEKAYLLNHYLEEFRGTVFRQVMFAEFEKEIHARAESGEALTVDSLNSIYFNLNKKYYAPATDLDDEIKIEWARIPHFYNSFYVYKYATGFSAAVALSSMILGEGDPAVKRYLNFLASGSSDYPVELLKKAGVDLSSPSPVLAALKVFEEILDQLEELIH